MEFPSMQAARAWHGSAAYREVRENQLKGAVYRGVIVQGL
jgi:uncharacterized protein (DUF1330 family)